MATTAACSAPFTTAAPAELRQAILPDDVPQFDPSYREALDAAAETLPSPASPSHLRLRRRARLGAVETRACPGRMTWMTYSAAQVACRVSSGRPAATTGGERWRTLFLIVPGCVIFPIMPV